MPSGGVAANLRESGDQRSLCQQEEATAPVVAKPVAKPAVRLFRF